jgi:hypothetical protein
LAAAGGAAVGVVVEGVAAEEAEAHRNLPISTKPLRHKESVRSPDQGAALRQAQGKLVRAAQARQYQHEDILLRQGFGGQAPTQRKTSEPETKA